MSDTFDHEGDAYESDLRHEERYYDGTEMHRSYSAPKTVSCKYCNQVGFTWTTRKGKWYMQDGRGELHLCRSETAKAKTEALVFKKKGDTSLSIDQINDLLMEAAKLDKQDRFN